MQSSQAHPQFYNEDDNQQLDLMPQGLSDEDLTADLKNLESNLIDSMPVESQSSDNGRINEQEANDLQFFDKNPEVDEHGYTETKIVIKKKNLTRSIFTIDEEDNENTVLTSKISMGLISCD